MKQLSQDTHLMNHFVYLLNQKHFTVFKKDIKMFETVKKHKNSKNWFK